MQKLDGFAEVALFVDDLARSGAFYEQILGLKKIESSERGCVFRVAARQVLLLVTRRAARTPSRTPGGLVPSCAVAHRAGPGPGHIAFGLSPRALESWRRQLEGHGVEVLSYVAWPRGARSLYFRDPDGHLIELATPGIWYTRRG
ncbi:MAG: VOC family protein [Acidobacteria bacterium]|nr:VOC family protein [Acidobacteriota bacterium]MBI3473443.1 VOC family protein [Candidatus Solibacter usitatus]